MWRGADLHNDLVTERMGLEKGGRIVRAQEQSHVSISLSTEMSHDAQKHTGCQRRLCVLRCQHLGDHANTGGRCKWLLEMQV